MKTKDAPSAATHPANHAHSKVSRATYFLQGAVKAESHLATCGPALAAMAKRINKQSPTPIPTYRNSDGEFMYMPGAGFRSKLRGAACALVLEAIDARQGRRFSLQDAQLNRVGGIKQGGTENALNLLAYAEMIRVNPILGLFGASTPWVKGRSMIGHLICKSPIPPMIVEGVRSDILKREPAMVEFLSEGALDEYAAGTAREKAYQLIKARMAVLDMTAKRGTPDERKAAKQESAALKQESDSKGLQQVSAQQPLNGYAAIPPNTEMDNKIALVAASQLELGCFVASMARFAEAPVLGAHGAHGAGVISGTWDVHKTGVGKIGSVTIEPFLGLAIDGDELVEAKEAFTAFIATEECHAYMNAASMMPSNNDNDGAGDE